VASVLAVQVRATMALPGEAATPDGTAGALEVTPLLGVSLLGESPPPQPANSSMIHTMPSGRNRWWFAWLWDMIM
jgi:hypothetical protein